MALNCFSNPINNRRGR